MRRSYKEVLRFVEDQAARGLPVPFTGKQYMKYRTFLSLNNPDEGPHNWRIRWRARNICKLNSRDIRRLGGID